MAALPHGVLMQPRENIDDAQKLQISWRAARVAMLPDNCHPSSFIINVFFWINVVY